VWQLCFFKPAQAAWWYQAFIGPVGNHPSNLTMLLPAFNASRLVTGTSLTGTNSGFLLLLATETCSDEVKALRDM
jgi:hypothetical protein